MRPACHLRVATDARIEYSRKRHTTGGGGCCRRQATELLKTIGQASKQVGESPDGSVPGPDLECVLESEPVVNSRATAGLWLRIHPLPSAVTLTSIFLPACCSGLIDHVLALGDRFHLQQLPRRRAGLPRPAACPA